MLVVGGTSFAYSLFLPSFHARRDRVVLLPPCSLYGAATLRPPPLGPGRGLTLPCGWNNDAGTRTRSRSSSRTTAISTSWVCRRASYSALRATRPGTTRVPLLTRAALGLWNTGGREGRRLFL